MKHRRPRREGGRTGPPAVLEAIADRLLPGERGQVVAGDLSEAFVSRRERGVGRVAASFVYLQELVASCWAVAIEPLTRRDPSPRPTRGDAALKRWIEELRFVTRSLARRPGFVLPIVLTLAIGIGIGSTVFSVVQATLLVRPGFADPDRLVMIWNRQRSDTESGHLMSGPDFADLRERTRTLSDVAAVHEVTVAPITGEGGARFARMGTCSANLFEVLGVEPRLGRLFRAADETPLPEGTPSVDAKPLPSPVVLSHGYWEREFGSDPDVVGRRFFSFTFEQVVVGVLPPDFQLVLPQEALMGEDLGAAIDYWSVFRTDYSQWNRDSRGLRLVGRLAEGHGLADARGELGNVANQLRSEYELHERNGLRLGAEPLVEQSSSHLRPLLALLAGAVLGVLLVACVNAAGLMLTGVVSREREIDIRSAMGASRPALARLLLTESLLLGSLGAVLGLVMALGGMRLLQWLSPAGLPQAAALHLDRGVLAFALGLALLTSLLAGLLPTLRAARGQQELAGHRHTASRHHRRVQERMVMAQVAVTVLLLVGTGLLLRTFERLRSVPLGFESEGVLTADFSTIGPLPDRSRENWRAEWIERRRAYERALGERLAELPGVEAAGAVFPVPLNGVYSRTCEWSREPEGDTEIATGVAYFRNVWPGYFESLSIALLTGRDFTFDDDQAGLGEWAALADGPRLDQPRVVIDERLADRLWPGENPIGRRMTFRIYADVPHDAEVIGVVPFVPQTGVLDPMETIYIPRSYYRSQELTLTVALEADTPRAREAITAAIHDVFGDGPVAFRPLDDYVHRALAPQRFALTLLGVFAGIALLLASIGLYGTMALMVKRRTREIGVQMAMGAAPRDVGRSVVGRAAVIGSVGIAIGGVLALLLSRFLEALLFEVAPTDPIAFAGAALFMLLTALLAAWLPARRAARVDPTTALRTD